MRLPDLPCHILDEVSEAMAVLDQNGLVVYSNHAFESLEKDFFHPAKPNVRKRLTRLVPKTLLSERALPGNSVRLSLKGKTLDVFVRPLNPPDGEDWFYFVLVKPGREQERPDLSISSGLSDLYSRERLGLSEALAPEFGELKGEEPIFRKALLTAQKAAKTDLPVLILGESGTGKEILARTIHRAGRRGKKNFVDINCAAIPENLIESELFGYEKGAFTGAGPKGRRGLFEEAHEGSIFLDEIGDASLQIQSKILRVLQEGCFKRVGGNRNIEVNVRHISATNRDLDVLIGEERFREDLFYRLNTITIELPPLRKRPIDIPMLIEHFVAEHARREDRRILFSSECLELMESYGWPGNVRELKGVVDYAITMASGSSLVTPDCLPSFLAPQRKPKQLNSGAKPLPSAVNIEMSHTLPSVVERVEKELIKQVLDNTTNRSEAIKKLGISRRTFYIKIKQYGLE
jgi:transcriptional regulator with PAS, ATPase and Fis domain